MTDDLNQIGPWIIEGLMTTLSPDGQLNIAPMGPRVNADCSQFVLRPFKTSTTYRNLKASGQGVFHVTDDALLIARAAVGLLDRYPAPATQQAGHIRGAILTQACRYHELHVVSLDDAQDRTTIHLRCVHAQSLRDFFGFNRARHAVIEAAILATRVHLTGSESVLAEFEKLQVMVDKTGGPDEHLAMSELKEYVRQFKRI
jgi:hypothetical protein